MYSYENIIDRSESNDEMVLNYTDAMELLYIYENDNTRVLGWEGWVKHPDGNLGHSQKHQGTANLSHLPKTSAIAFIKCTIMQAHTEWEEKPEFNDAELLFCITTNT